MLAAEIMLVVNRNADAGDLVSVCVKYSCIDIICAGMNFDVVYRSSLDGIAFAVLENLCKTVGTVLE